MDTAQTVQSCSERDCHLSHLGAHTAARLDTRLLCPCLPPPPHASGSAAPRRSQVYSVATREPSTGNRKEARGQPPEARGLMATSSHNTGVRHLPYNAFQSTSDKHNLYTSLTSWASPHNLLPPSSSSPAMFQVPGTSAHQHHLPASIPPFSESLPYVPAQPAHPGWQSYRPETNCDDGFPSRPSEHYAYADSASSVPQSSPSGTRPPALSRVHDLLHAQPMGAIAPAHNGQDNHFNVRRTFPLPPSRKCLTYFTELFRATRSSYVSFQCSNSHHTSATNGVCSAWCRPAPRTISTV